MFKGEVGEGAAAVARAPCASATPLRRDRHSPAPRLPVEAGAAPGRAFTSKAGGGSRRPGPGQPGLTKGWVGPPAGQVDDGGRASTADHDGGAGGEAVGPVDREPGWSRDE